MIKDQQIIEVFKERDGNETKVELRSGKKISVWNIAWGYDIDDEFAHITSNISPKIENATIDFFYTSDIKNLYTAEKELINMGE